MASTTPTALPPIVSREEWQAARDQLLAKEKAHTRAGDAIAAERRRLPMVEITTDYVFAGEDGAARLIDLFDGRRQLIVQHFMFHPAWEDGCPGCTNMANHINAVPPYLNPKDTSLVLISRAPLEKLLAYRERKGWSLPWYSSFGTTFNEDFQATVDGNESQGISAFLRDGERVFHTYHTTGRGVEPVMSTFKLLDLTAYGRQEAWEDSPEGWPQS